MSVGLKEVALRQLGRLGRLKSALESILVIAGIVGLTLTVWHHFDSQSPAALSGEGKRVVAFRQLANRICTESRRNIRRAANQRVPDSKRLDYTGRALRWDLSDLEGITAPPTRFDSFVAEVKVRARAERKVLALGNAVASGDGARQAESIASLRSLEIESHELSREAGISRCMSILPPLQTLVGRGTKRS
jgi:hypothetical protein